MSTILNNPKMTTAVLISLGSLTDTQSMLPQMKLAFVHSFMRFPEIQFIWKFSRNESDHFENNLFAGAPNVHPFEWVEQKAILGIMHKHFDCSDKCSIEYDPPYSFVLK